MKSRCCLALLLVCGFAHADPEEELLFAQRLGARGLKTMAFKVLDRLEKSSNPAEARAGRYGKSVLRKQEASLARARIAQDIEAGVALSITRAQVVALYEDAKTKITDYVNARADADEARFLLGELLQEYAEFLTGKDLPEEMAEEREKLISKNKDEAAKLFAEAISHYQQVYDKVSKSLPPNVETTDPRYVLASRAEFGRGLARFRWALIYPKGPNFQFRADEAIEELDEFLQRHFDEAFGAYAMIYLGRAFLEKGLRLGDVDDAETGVNYFENVCSDIREDPAVPSTMDILGRGYYWYVRACNALASGAGNLKKPQPVFYENSLKAGADMRHKLKAGAKHEWALRASLEVAEAYAAQRKYEDAVLLAGEVLASARVTGQRRVTQVATTKLTGWVASVRGAGALAPSLLFQIGESLAVQNRVGNAVTFYEKAFTASVTESDREDWGYPALLKIAIVYRKDMRLHAAAKVAQVVVDAFLKSGQDSESDFGLTASEACNQARLALRSISDATKSSVDEQEYNRVLGTFRTKFPGHPQNSDSAYSAAAEVYGKGDYEAAARQFKEIANTSNNYWRAQRRVPLCYRILAQAEKDEANRKQWYEKSLAAAAELVKLGKLRMGDPDAMKGIQYGELYTAMGQASLGMWPEALKTIDAYLGRYPDQFIKRGLELDLKLRAHLALGQLDQAEAALAALKDKTPASPYITGANYDVYVALKKHYKPMGAGDTRTAIAMRTSKLWKERLSNEKKPTSTHFYALGDVLRDAGEWQAAGEAFESAAGMVAEPPRKSFFLLKAAEMQFKAAKAGGLGRAEYTKVLNKTRGLFTDVLIPDKSQQDKVLKRLGDWKKYPDKATFGAIKRQPAVLLTAAEVYNESGPGGADSRWIAVRLIDHLHTFSRAIPEEGNEKLKELVPYWWAGTELKLRIMLGIAESGSGGASRAAATKGFSFAKKIIFQYTKMDGPERVARIKDLEVKLRRAAQK